VREKERETKRWTKSVYAMDKECECVTKSVYAMDKECLGQSV